MLTTLRAPALAATSVDTPEPSSTTNPGRYFLTISVIVKSKSGEAAQLLVGGIGDLKSSNCVN